MEYLSSSFLSIPAEFNRVEFVFAQLTVELQRISGMLNDSLKNHFAVVDINCIFFFQWVFGVVDDSSLIRTKPYHSKHLNMKGDQLKGNLGLGYFNLAVHMVPTYGSTGLVLLVKRCWPAFMCLVVRKRSEVFVFFQAYFGWNPLVGKRWAKTLRKRSPLKGWPGPQNLELHRLQLPYQNKAFFLITSAQQCPKCLRTLWTLKTLKKRYL